MRRRRRRWAALIAGVALLGALLGIVTVPYDAGDLDPSAFGAVVLTDRHGEVLRSSPGAEGVRARWVPLEAISPRVIDATLLAEDRRFRRHPGIDAVAVIRAALGNLRAGRVVSGGSTVTQQLAGLVWPEPRTPAGKLREAVRAVRLEIDLSKDEILEQYLNRLPYGAGVRGIGAASEVWFGRSPAALDVVAAATLAAIPQAPGRFTRPGNLPLLAGRRDRILRAMERRGLLGEAELAEALGAPVTLERRVPPRRAGHFADQVLLDRRGPLLAASKIVTTLDLRLQKDVESIVRSVLDRMPEAGATQCAAVVLDVDRGEILALVGSESWTHPGEGQVNGALALRQPGSALKPFLYAGTFARGASPADPIPDVPFARADARGEVVEPRNYDHRFRGPVRMREALGNSLNVPAVRVQDALGEGEALTLLRAAGLTSLEEDPARYGLGLTLGVGEVTLLELTTAYAGLARGGVWRPAVSVLEARGVGDRPLPLPGNSDGGRWTSPEAAFLVADILSDDHARGEGFGRASVLALPFPVAVKTGTSTGYRDSWCAGFTDEHAVGVWVGNFDGSPMHGSSGVAAAGPVFRQILLRLHEAGGRPLHLETPAEWARRPVCSLSGERPGTGCVGIVEEWFGPGSWEERPRCRFHSEDSGPLAWPAAYRAWAGEHDLLDPDAPTEERAPAILTPVEGSVYFLDPRSSHPERIRIVVDPGGADCEVRLDGRILVPGPGGELFWPAVRGEHRIEIVGPGGRASRRFSVR